ncbi:Hypothetical predicted protein [Cloeon dipterum]|uniref:Gustatory receptor n=1 Tax=Cloeon dipterum TaxID=197152 RepID=A0A8S1BSZ8_9INSE|nr:Hypothetical predicted protein [Cloeon dipterum]
MMATNTYLREVTPILRLYNLVGGPRLVEAFEPIGNRYSVRIKWLSWSTVYSAAALVLQYSIVHTMASKAFQTFDRVEESRKLYALIFLFFLFGPFMVPCLMFLQHWNVCKTCVSWFYFEQKIKLIITTQAPLDFGVHSWIKLAMIYTVLVGFIAVFFFPWIMGTWPDGVDFLIALGFFYNSMLYCICYANCQAIRAISDRILVELQASIKEVRQGNLDERRLLFFRDTWLNLIGVMKETGDSIYMPICFTMVIDFSVALFMGYAIIVSEIKPDGFVVLTSCSAIAWLGIVIICWGAQETEYKIKHDFGEAIGCLKTSHVSEKASFLVNMHYTLTGMLKNLPPLNFGGYICIGKQLLVTFIYSYITNLVVMLQLQFVNSGIKDAKDLYDIRNILFS